MIESRPWGPDGVGITPTGITAVNAEGEPVDALNHPEKVQGHIGRGRTFDIRYNPILSDEPMAW